MTIVYGFEFETVVEPFAVYRLFNSLGICVAMASQSQLTTLSGYRTFFIICFLITLISQSIMGFVFVFKNKTNNKIGSAQSDQSILNAEEKTEMMLKDRKKKLKMSIQRIVEREGNESKS